jgi:hypothetical protein
MVATSSSKKPPIAPAGSENSEITLEKRTDEGQTFARTVAQRRISQIAHSHNSLASRIDKEVARSRVKVGTSDNFLEGFHVLGLNVDNI